MRKNNKYEIGQILLDKDHTVEVIGHKLFERGPNKKGYELFCHKCKQKFDRKEIQLDRGDRCPYCSSHKVLIGYNDLWTKSPMVASWLRDESDGYKYTQFSNKQVEFLCPNCGNALGFKRIADVVRYKKLSCKKCGDGISYPNKIMFNLLKQLNIKFETEKTFDWCRFISYNGKYTAIGFYDFYVTEKRLLIEMDSDLGHGKVVYKNSKKTALDTAYIDECKNSLAKENGYRIIRVNCSYTDNNNDVFLACRRGITESLEGIFDLSRVDWNAVMMQSLKSVVITSCEMYNTGYSAANIAKELKLDFSTVCDYLHKGTDIGICEFVPRKQTNIGRNDSKPVMSIEPMYIFDSVTTLAKHSMDIYGFKVVPSSFYNRPDNYKKIQWKRISKEEFNRYIEMFPDRCFGDKYKLLK